MHALIICPNANSCTAGSRRKAVELRSTGNGRERGAPAQVSQGRLMVRPLAFASLSLLGLRFLRLLRGRFGRMFFRLRCGLRRFCLLLRLGVGGGLRSRTLRGRWRNCRRRDCNRRFSFAFCHHTLLARRGRCWCGTSGSFRSTTAPRGRWRWRWRWGQRLQIFQNLCTRT